MDLNYYGHMGPQGWVIWLHGKGKVPARDSEISPPTTPFQAAIEREIEDGFGWRRDLFTPETTSERLERYDREAVRRVEAHLVLVQEPRRRQVAREAYQKGRTWRKFEI
jgi:hypothetical protein